MNLVSLRLKWLKIRSRLPIFFQEKILYLGNFFFSQKFIKKNRELKNIHLSKKRCFVIGNGPSLKNQDLIPLKNEITFVANKFYLHKDFDEITPKYYTIIDPLPFGEEETKINFLKTLQEKASQCTFFFPYWATSLFRKYNLFQNHKVYYLAMVGRIKENNNFQIQIDRQIPSLINVVLASLFIAKYLGFKTIYLLGCDHDWLAQPIDAYPTHFYDKDPLYEGPSETYEENLANTLNLFRSYRLIKKKFNEVKIYNATKGGFLDVFERVDYNSVIKNIK